MPQSRRLDKRPWESLDKTWGIRLFNTGGDASALNRSMNQEEYKDYVSKETRGNQLKQESAQGVLSVLRKQLKIEKDLGQLLLDDRDNGNGRDWVEDLHADDHACKSPTQHDVHLRHAHSTT